MKLTNCTTPQSKNYLCNKCKSFTCHKDMHDDNYCYHCMEERAKELDLK